ncbi:MAG: hypothetical protein ACK45I_03920, partial [Bacteroidota bacterium]
SKARLLRSLLFSCFAHYQTRLSELCIKKADQRFGFRFVAGAGLAHLRSLDLWGGITHPKHACFAVFFFHASFTIKHV